MQLVFSWAPKLAKSVRVNIGFPVVRTDGRRSVYGHVITKLLGLVDLLRYGAPPTRARSASGAPLVSIFSLSPYISFRFVSFCRIE